jgi:RimJ/RimL family protein N-acetyltransferase
MVFETGRMLFRPVRVSDARLLFELDSDPEVMKHISHGEPTPWDGMRHVLIPRILSQYRQWRPAAFWVAFLRDTREFCGWFHLRPDRIDPDEMEFGYRLPKAVWGRGLATEGSCALVKMAFGPWRYQKLCARTLVPNLASQRVMQKAGLKFEREFHYSLEVIPGWTEEERRAVKYSLRREDYIPNAA